MPATHCDLEERLTRELAKLVELTSSQVKKIPVDELRERAKWGNDETILVADSLFYLRSSYPVELMGGFLSFNDYNKLLDRWVGMRPYRWPFTRNKPPGMNNHLWRQKAVQRLKADSILWKTIFHTALRGVSTENRAEVLDVLSSKANGDPLMFCNVLGVAPLTLLEILDCHQVRRHGIEQLRLAVRKDDLGKFAQSAECVKNSLFDQHPVDTDGSYSFAVNDAYEKLKAVIDSLKVLRSERYKELGLAETKPGKKSRAIDSEFRYTIVDMIQTIPEKFNFRLPREIELPIMTCLVVAAFPEKFKGLATKDKGALIDTASDERRAKIATGMLRKVRHEYLQPYQRLLPAWDKHTHPKVIEHQVEVERLGSKPGRRRR